MHNTPWRRYYTRQAAHERTGAFYKNIESADMVGKKTILMPRTHLPQFQSLDRLPRQAERVRYSE